MASSKSKKDDTTITISCSFYGGTPKDVPDSVTLSSADFKKIGEVAKRMKKEE